MTTHPIPDAALLQHLALLGKTGSGKTTTAKLIVEHLADRGDRICILDPIKSDWWGLTSSANGREPGLPFVILGGPHGNLPLNPASGAALAGIVSDGSLPLSILDMADFGPGQHARFFIDFAPVLLRKMRGVVYLVLEEAHIFAPKERSGVGDENMTVHWAKMLATAGRSKGIRLILLTQRTQALHNALLGSCDTMIAHRLTAPADQKPVMDWLKANAEKDVVTQVAASLSSLKTGSGWICSGEARVFERTAFPRIRTYDNTRTPDGDASVREVRTAQVDIAKLEAIMGAAADEAKAHDPRELRAEIARLKAELAKKQQGISAEESVATKAIAFEEGYAKGYADGASKASDAALQAVTVAFNEAIERLKTEPTWQMAPKGAGDTIRFHHRPATTGKLPPELVSKEYAPQIDRNKGQTLTGHLAAGDALPAGERAVLTVCAQYGQEGASNDEISLLCGYKARTRQDYLLRLRNKGFVEDRGGLSLATAAGIAALGPDFRPLPRGRELRDYWMARLPEGERRIFTLLVEAYPHGLKPETIDAKTGYKPRTRQDYLLRLRTRRLALNVAGGTVEASAILFDA